MIRKAKNVQIPIPPIEDPKLKKTHTSHKSEKDLAFKGREYFYTNTGQTGLDFPIMHLVYFFQIIIFPAFISHFIIFCTVNQDVAQDNIKILLLCK